MRSLYVDARQWAQDQSLANVPRLARLEGIAFQAHPEIVATFGADGASMAKMLARRPPSAGRRLGGLLTAIVIVVGLLAPVVGMAIYGQSRQGLLLGIDPLPAEVAVPISGVCFAIAALTQLVCAIVWLRGGARWSPPLLTLAAGTAVFAGFAAIGLPNVSEHDGFELGVWIWPVWITLLIAIPLAIAILLRFRSRAPEPEPEPRPSAPTVSDREHARVLVRALPEAERRSVQADRDEALHILADRGLLDDETLERALAADLGTLFTFDPIQGVKP